MRDLFIQKLLKKMSNDSSVILLTADLGFGAFNCFEKFRDKQYFNVGVSEQLMASMAAGFSHEGFNVFIYSIGVFPTLRCLEQIRNDISYHDCQVTIVTSGAGFSYGSLGMTHHCIQDIGYMSSIPNINIFTPANDFEMGNILEKKCGIKYIRLDKSQLKLSPYTKKSGNHFQCYFFNEKYNEEEKTLILSHGSIGEITKPILNEKYKVDFYTIPLIKETKQLINLCKPYKKILTIEEHSVINGFFSFISSMLTRNKVFKEIDYIALEHEHSSLVGDQNFLRKELKLNETQLLSKISK